ncbi:hypothetical protein KAFR_0E01750 [Kazachstania africana CBS 2517]|uniref:Myosin motor domain-containing protein n=1 Tax=Kazachstania africana (strain ATCC 22294 / BCRC 22015 / CBS 2517 / CECT 1963 / NBRC 1671 / NRRL Y-8276) TaxID=1071382 RepID=H2AVC9_KAZAF|nr:hypothetical protein KAFR_0E01750 [Kazachstania africana CBS 2517]CCF58329.1 hypothetical protein KAFR_0E01750 [Kazachstania africana CBS 2517]
MGDPQLTSIWVPHETETFVKAEFTSKISKRNPSKNVEEEFANVKLIDTNENKQFPIRDVHPVNPPSFDKIDDMSELTHLNEPSVLYNLENRYKDDLIYTYSGLFLVAINPYSNIKTYSQEYIDLYNGSSKDENKPHIFAVAEEAYQNLLTEKLNQSILVTGESGAGKTENTKKILQYLAAITSSKNKSTNVLQTPTLEKVEGFEMKILQSNPILESFGNSQTVRNNNSSRFGKFIKIEFDERGKINGAHIEWYLLEKSRVVNQHKEERNYHIFYEFLNGLSENELHSKYKLPSNSISDYKYLSASNHIIPGVNDKANFDELLKAFSTVGFSQGEVEDILKIISITLHIGNVEFVSEKTEQAAFKNDTTDLTELLGIENSEFNTAILKPKSKAGKEWVSQSKNATQARFILNSLSRTLYELLFSHIVERINKSLDHGSMTANYIGLLDIAGFEIFKHNSFEQLCINYTNEKLQQFFNHHMFVLEQTEYVKENIQWDYIDYGKDLQSTIDLIEQKLSPSGILPLLDEESILPKSTDNSFFEKLINSWEKKSDRFKRSKLEHCFVLKHYAGDVEYDVEGWLSKNKDPLNENLSNVLSNSKNNLIAKFFNKDTTDNKDDTPSSHKNRSHGKSLRTASSRHREQQIYLLNQLNTTHPHFVRCIIPNNLKMARNFDRRLILDQLRCNGVLEGIRIAREGYPNRIFFKEFYQRYNILTSAEDGITFNKRDFKRNSQLILSSLSLDPSLFKVGNTKLFFKAGVLATLENKKENRIMQITSSFNSAIRGSIVRRHTTIQQRKLKSARIIGTTFRKYNELMNDPWFNLFTKVKPLLSSAQDISRAKKFNEQIKELKIAIEKKEQEKISILDLHKDVSNELREVRQLLQQESENLEEKEKLLADNETKRIILEKELEKELELKELHETKQKKSVQEYESLQEQIISTKNLLSEKEDCISNLTSKNKVLLDDIAKLKSLSSSKTSEYENLISENEKLVKKLEELERIEQEKQSEIDTLQKKLNSSKQNLDIKLVTLEKNCNAAMSRLQGLVNENISLRSDIDSLKKEKQKIDLLLSKKVTEVERLSNKIENNYKEMEAVSKQRDTVVSEHDKLGKELKEANQKYLDMKQKYEELEGSFTALQKRFSNDEKQNEQSKGASSKIETLENRLNQEISLNTYLTSRLSSTRNNENIDDSILLGGSDMKEENLIEKYMEMKIKLKETSRLLEEEINERKNLISRLSFTETRLASSSFDFQQARAQVKKLKEIIEKSGIEVDIDFDLSKISTKDDVNIEKLILEVQYLKRQLDVETKAHYDAENVAAALHEKFTKIQRVDSSSDIYKLKFEASEQKVKSLENKIKHMPLKDRTNLQSSGEIFRNRKEYSKIDEELKAYKFENYKLQEHVDESYNLINKLNFEMKQASSKEALLNEQIQMLAKDLEGTERQKELFANTVKQQKAQYESCLNDLHENEKQLKDYINALMQAEEDIKSMTEIIEKLKAQNKQKDKAIWEKETAKNDLEMKLQECELELKRIQGINKMLTSDLSHFKERVAEATDTSQYENEIKELKDQLDMGFKTESSLRKEISTLNYKLETLNNDYEAKISDLLKQNEHYARVTETLNNEKDETIASKVELSKEYQALLLRSNDLSSNVELLINENGRLKSELESSRDAITKSSAEFGELSQEKEDILNKMKYLEETLELQKEQSERNEELVQNLQKDINYFREKYDNEKQKNINLFEENQTLVRQSEQLGSKLQSLNEKLSDTREKDAWLSKISELEEMLSSETDEKYNLLKGLKSQERAIQELEEKNMKQADVINLANEDRKQFEISVVQYNEQLGQLENLVSQQELQMKKATRENTLYQDKIQELEREIAFWRERYDKNNANNEQQQNSAFQTEEIMS